MERDMGELKASGFAHGLDVDSHRQEARASFWVKPSCDLGNGDKAKPFKIQINCSCICKVSPRNNHLSFAYTSLGTLSTFWRVSELSVYLFLSTEEQDPYGFS